MQKTKLTIIIAVLTTFLVSVPLANAKWTLDNHQWQTDTWIIDGQPTPTPATPRH